MGQMRMNKEFERGNLNRRGKFGDLCIFGEIINGS
jgi:hypothetical protein